MSVRSDWTKDEIKDIFHLPFFSLLERARKTHTSYFESNDIQLSSLLSIKTGTCPEDCKFCSQSAHYNSDVAKKDNLLDEVDKVINSAKQAVKAGAERFCLGAAWRSPNDKNLAKVAKLVREIKKLGLETCCTLGMISYDQALTLKEAGLDFYNHNIDTSEEYYDSIVTTRKFSERIETLKNVKKANIRVCSGIIVGMGESEEDRISMLNTLATLKSHPESVPINLLIKMKGTPLEKAPDLDPFELIKVVAVARIVMPKSYIRLSAGRTTLSDECQALCFFSGANSIFVGEKLLTASNPSKDHDMKLLEKLGLNCVEET